VRISIRTRLIASLLFVALVSAGGLSAYFLNELEAYGLRQLEVRLDTQARLTASIVGATLIHEGDLSAADSTALNAALREVGPATTTRLQMLDTSGVSIADSEGSAGETYVDMPEVAEALAGESGVHTRILKDGRVALYVTRPVLIDDHVCGVAYASSSTFSAMTLLRDDSARLVAFIAMFLVVAAVIAEALTRWLARPLTDLERGAKKLASGDHTARVKPTGSRETIALAETFNSMAAEVEHVVTELKVEEKRQIRFVSDVSHELRTPLTAIRGTAETLLEGDVPEPITQRFLTTIVAESDRLARLADDLLVLQRIEGGTGELPFSRTNLSIAVDRALHAMDAVAAERGVSIEVSGEAPDILGNLDRLQQVIANLLDNATRMTPTGGVVSVTLARHDYSAVLSITDQGPGIPEEDLPHLFERFYRAQPCRSRQTGGAGLGLAIVKAIAHVHAGTIDVENVPGGGARFVLSLPALRD